MSKVKKISNNTREFLLTFFNDTDVYTEKYINGFWLIKQFDGAKDMWTVYVYTQDSYNNYKRGQEKYNEMKTNGLF